MTDTINFRSEAESEQYDNTNKPFLSILPPGSGKVFCFYVFLLLTITASLFLVKLPGKVLGTGIITSGNQSVSLSLNYDNYQVSDILIEDGQDVIKNQPLLILSQKYVPEYKKSRAHIIEQLALIDEQMEDVHLFSRVKQSSLKSSLEQQHILTKSISDHLDESIEIEQEALLHFKDGLSSKMDWQDEQGQVSQLRTSLEESRMAIITLRNNIDEFDFTQKEKLQSLAEKKISLLSELESIQDITINSPCDCTVNQILVSKQQPVENGQTGVLLTKLDEGDTADVFIPSKSYSPVKEGTTVLIKPEAFPSMKYGIIKGKIIKAYSAPISGKEYPKLFEDKEHYFRLTVQIEDIPENILLQTGMLFDAEVIVRYQTLIQFLTE